MCSRQKSSKAEARGCAMPCAPTAQHGARLAVRHTVTRENPAGAF